MIKGGGSILAKQDKTKVKQRNIVSLFLVRKFVCVNKWTWQGIK